MTTNSLLNSSSMVRQGLLSVLEPVTTCAIEGAATQLTVEMIEEAVEAMKRPEKRGPFYVCERWKDDDLIMRAAKDMASYFGYDGIAFTKEADNG